MLQQCLRRASSFVLTFYHFLTARGGRQTTASLAPVIPAIGGPTSAESSTPHVLQELTAGIRHAGIVKMKINVWRRQCNARTLDRVEIFMDWQRYTGLLYACLRTPPTEREARRRDQDTEGRVGICFVNSFIPFGRVESSLGVFANVFLDLRSPSPHKPQIQPRKY